MDFDDEGVEADIGVFDIGVIGAADFGVSDIDDWLSEFLLSINDSARLVGKIWQCPVVSLLKRCCFELGDFIGDVS